jgi:transposase-like protein
MRNVLDAVTKALKDEIYKYVRVVLDAPNLKAARMLLYQALAKFGEQEPKAMQLLETSLNDVTAMLCLPEK